MFCLHTKTQPCGQDSELQNAFQIIVNGSAEVQTYQLVSDLSSNTSCHALRRESLFFRKLIAILETDDKLCHVTNWDACFRLGR